MNAPEIRLATIEDQTAVIRTVRQAFDADPGFRWFFPDPESWERNVDPFIAMLFNTSVDQRAAWIIDDAKAVALWIAPNDGDPMPFSYGELDDDAARRLELFDEATTEGLPDTPFWYLDTLGTHPEHTGKGLGQAAIGPGLACAAESGLPAYLETTNPSNVELYVRSGWVVSSANAVDTNLTVWVLHHDGIARNA